MRRQDGIMFLALMLFVAIMGTGLALVGQVWRTNLQREQEDELLFVGMQYQRAIGQYFDNSPTSVKQYPQNLSDLTLDTRYPSTKRYLRKLFPDPFTHKLNWGVVRAPDGGVIGIYSMMKMQPLRDASKLKDDVTISKRAGYSAWTFMHKQVGLTQPALGAQLNTHDKKNPSSIVPLPSTSSPFDSPSIDR